MRPVPNEFPDSQQFGEGATRGVTGNTNAPSDAIEYYVGLYGDYQHDGHAGKDIACPIGTPVRAMADGVVLYAGWADDLPGDDSWSASGYFRRWALYKYFGGIVTVVQHPWGIGVYAHQSNNDAVTAGQQVTEGQVIGLSGNTKTRTTTVAPHLHVEALIDLSYSTGNGLIYGRTDPTPYFGGIAAQGTITQEDDMASFSDYTIHDKDGNPTSPENVLNSVDGKEDRNGGKLDLLLALVGASTTFTANDGSTVTVAEQFRSFDNKLDSLRAENLALRSALSNIRALPDVAPAVTAAVDKAFSNLTFTVKGAAA